MQTPLKGMGESHEDEAFALTTQVGREVFMLGFKVILPDPSMTISRKSFHDISNNPIQKLFEQIYNMYISPTVIEQIDLRYKFGVYIIKGE